MDQQEEHSLSRAVSSLDLNAALAATQKTLRDGCYSTADLLKLRPMSEEAGQDVETKAPEGILTPPDMVMPKPPPPTPEDTHSIDAVVANDAAGEIADDLAEDELNEAGIQVVPAGSEAPKKKKKKKKSGANKKAKPTGFEGECSLSERYNFR